MDWVKVSSLAIALIGATNGALVALQSRETESAFRFIGLLALMTSVAIVVAMIRGGWDRILLGSACLLTALVAWDALQGNRVNDDPMTSPLLSYLFLNIDDHMRNHGFIRAATGWELSPAYDINTDVEQAHTSSSAVDGHDGPGKLDALIRNADYFRLDDTTAIMILKEINDAVDGIDDVVADYPTSDTTKQLQELLNSRPTR